MKVEILSYTQDPVISIEKAASVCYDSTPTGDGKIMKACVKSGHTSVTEHASFEFKITGVSRALLAQLTRHRMASYSVRSQRYVAENNFGYITPPSVEANAEQKDIYDFMMKKIGEAYEMMVSAGIPKEDARMILPNACETTIVMTMNVRELMNFCHERMCTRAQWEIRELAYKMYDAVQEIAPEIAHFMVPKCQQYEVHFCPEAKSCGRHKRLKEIVKDEYIE